MSSYNNGTGNENDYLSVTLGLVHNLGAGGVHSMGNVRLFNLPIPVSDKRIDQWFKRTDRAVGERP